MKYLALDIGNVCVRISPETCFLKLGSPAPDVALKLLNTERLFECGKISESDFVDQMDKLFAGKFSEAELRAAFAAILVEPVRGMNELVAAMPEMGIQPVFFSDISEVHLRQAREMFPAAEKVPQGVYSCRVGVMKPGIEMFEDFEARFGAPYLYVDDRAELIDAALKHGWNAARFTGSEDLRKLLEEI